uniref:Uncharacterized protein n=1 Tax=viral metagenome TaxID=1070528 RepID=A0A6M3IHQ5_9ZZZZ
MFRNKFNPTILAVVLIALLCFFLPDVKAQEKPDTNRTIYTSGNDFYKPDTIAVVMFIATDSIPMNGGCWYKFPAKVLIAIDGYSSRDSWYGKMKYFDEKKQPMKDEVYISLPRKVGKK